MEFIQIQEFPKTLHLYLLSLILFALHLLALVSGTVVFHFIATFHILVCLCLFKCFFHCENSKFLPMAVWSLLLHICQGFT